MATRTAILTCLGCALSGVVGGILVASPANEFLGSVGDRKTVTFEQSDNMHYMESRVIQAERAVAMIDSGAEKQLQFDLEREAQFISTGAETLAAGKVPMFRRMMEHDIDTFLSILNDSIDEGYRPSPHLLLVLSQVRESRKASKYVADDEHLQREVEAAYRNIPKAAQ